jgi:hypothetical protein
MEDTQKIIITFEGVEYNINQATLYSNVLGITKKIGIQKVFLFYKKCAQLYFSTPEERLIQQSTLEILRNNFIKFEQDKIDNCEMLFESYIDYTSFDAKMHESWKHITIYASCFLKTDKEFLDTLIHLEKKEALDQCFRFGLYMFKITDFRYIVDKYESIFKILILNMNTEILHRYPDDCLRFLTLDADPKDVIKYFNYNLHKSFSIYSMDLNINSFSNFIYQISHFGSNYEPKIFFSEFLFQKANFLLSFGEYRKIDDSHLHFYHSSKIKEFFSKIPTEKIKVEVLYKKSFSEVFLVIPNTKNKFILNFKENHVNYLSQNILDTIDSMLKLKMQTTKNLEELANIRSLYKTFVIRQKIDYIFETQENPLFYIFTDKECGDLVKIILNEEDSLNDLMRIALIHNTRVSHSYSLVTQIANFLKYPSRHGTFKLVTSNREALKLFCSSLSLLTKKYRNITEVVEYISSKKESASKIDLNSELKLNCFATGIHESIELILLEYKRNIDDAKELLSKATTLFSAKNALISLLIHFPNLEEAIECFQIIQSTYDAGIICKPAQIEKIKNCGFNESIINNIKNSKKFIQKTKKCNTFETLKDILLKEETKDLSSQGAIIKQYLEMEPSMDLKDFPRNIIEMICNISPQLKSIWFQRQVELEPEVLGQLPAQEETKAPKCPQELPTEPKELKKSKEPTKPKELFKPEELPKPKEPHKKEEPQRQEESVKQEKLKKPQELPIEFKEQIRGPDYNKTLKLFQKSSMNIVNFLTLYQDRRISEMPHKKIQEFFKSLYSHYLGEKVEVANPTMLSFLDYTFNRALSSDTSLESVRFEPNTNSLLIQLNGAQGFITIAELRHIDESKTEKVDTKEFISSSELLKRNPDSSTTECVVVSSPHLSPSIIRSVLQEFSDTRGENLEKILISLSGMLRPVE